MFGGHGWAGVGGPVKKNLLAFNSGDGCPSWGPARGRETPANPSTCHSQIRASDSEESYLNSANGHQGNYLHQDWDKVQGSLRTGQECTMSLTETVSRDGRQNTEREVTSARPICQKRTIWREELKVSDWSCWESSIGLIGGK